MLLFNDCYLFVVVIEDDFKHSLGTGLHTLSATVALAGVYTYIPIPRTIRIAKISDITQKDRPLLQAIFRSLSANPRAKRAAPIAPAI